MADASKSIAIPQIEKLRGAPNYHFWRSMAVTFLDIMGVWKIVNGQTPKPSATDTQDLETWLHLSQRAKGFLLLNVDKALLPLVSSAVDAPTAWARLEEKFDRKTANNLHALIKSIVTLRCSNKREVASHIEKYDELWQRLIERTSQPAAVRLAGNSSGSATSNRSSSATVSSESSSSATPIETVESILQPLALSTVAKGVFFLSSLPISLDTVIENLTTKESITYDEICNKLLDLYSADMPAGDGAAFATTSNEKPKRDDKVCTYCKSKGFRGLGHVVDDCRTKKKDADTPQSAAAAIEIESQSFAFATTETERHSSRLSLLAEERTFPHDAWIFDTGATSHMTPDASRITEACPTNIEITVGNGNKLPATQVGTAMVKTLLADGTTRDVALHNTLVVPSLQFSLMSWRRMADAGASKIGDHEGTKVFLDKQVVIETVPHAGLEVVRTSDEISAISVMQLHRKLAHLPPSAFSTLRKHSLGLPPIPSVIGNFDCRACNKAKFTRTIPKVRSTRAQLAYHTIHSDICGPFSETTPKGSRYFISAIDEFSHRAEVRFLRTRDEAPQALLDMIRLVERQYNIIVKAVQTDNAGEMTSNWFERGLAEMGIKHQLSIAYIHETNGLAERFNQTVVGSARALLYDADLPLALWAEAVAHATYTKNRLPHIDLSGASPDEAVSGQKPSLAHMQAFGSPAYVFIPEEKRKVAGKLLPRSLEGFLVGYTTSRNQYRFWIPSLCKIVVSRDFRARATSLSNYNHNTTLSANPQQKLIETSPNLFDKNTIESSSSESHQPPQTIEPTVEQNEAGSLPLSEGENLQAGSTSNAIMVQPPQAAMSPSQPDTPSTAPVSTPITTRAGRQVKPPARFREWAEVVAVAAAEVDADMPSLQEAMGGSEANSWTMAMMQKAEAIQKYETWEEMAPPPGARIVDTKWVLKKKRDQNSDVIRYKARLTVRGFSQVPGLDFDETFAAVVRTDTVRILLAHALQHSLSTHQYDIENAYLNAPIEEEIYIKAPTAVTVKEGNILRLRKSIYGLKQAARCWSDMLAAALAERGLKRSSADPALFVNDSRTEFVAVYVDDLLHIFSGESNFNTWLSSRFTIKDLGRPTYLLSIKLNWEGKTLRLSQTAYLERIIDKFLPSGGRAAKTPMSPGEKPEKREEADPKADIQKYQAAIGSLLYAALVTRPDIMYSVCCLSQFVSNPSVDHMRMVNNIFRYLAGTKSQTITYCRQNQAATSFLQVYSDASFANSLSDRKGFSGYAAFYCGCPVAWGSTKQQIVALSTTEAEYIALTNAVQSTVWLQRLLDEINSNSVGTKPTVFGDNISSHFLTRNPSLHRRSKHIDVRYHYIRELYERKKFKLEFVSGNKNPADLFTKAIQGDHFSYLLRYFFS